MSELAKVAIAVHDEPDVLTRIALVNSSVFRLLKRTTLKTVLTSDYSAGYVELLVEVDDLERLRENTPQLKPHVSVEVQEWSHLGF